MASTTSSLVIVLLDNAAQPAGPALVLVTDATLAMFQTAGVADARCRLWRVGGPVRRGDRLVLATDATPIER